MHFPSNSFSSLQIPSIEDLQKVTLPILDDKFPITGINLIAANAKAANTDIRFAISPPVYIFTIIVTIIATIHIVSIMALGNVLITFTLHSAMDDSLYDLSIFFRKNCSLPNNLTSLIPPKL